MTAASRPGRGTPDDPAIEVHLQLADGRLVATLPGAPGSGTTYAFYLHHNGRRIETRPYDPAPTAVFTHLAAPGRYTATVFVRPEAPGARTTLAQSGLLRVPASPRTGPRPATRALELPALQTLPGLDSLAQLPLGERPVQFELDLDGLRHCALVGERRGDRLFVVLGGAVPLRSRVRLPRYSRFSWRERFPGTLMCLADPTLFLDDRLQLGWYVGDRTRNATPSCVAVALAVAQALGLTRDQVVFWGSSGGGYAALQMAAALGGECAAVAVNAQTAILRYGVDSSLSHFLQACFPGLSPAELLAAHADRLDAASTWSRERLRARAVLLQNDVDRHHLRDHFQPFLQAVRDVPESDRRIRALRYQHPDGHGAESIDMVEGLLGELARTDAFGAQGPTSHNLVEPSSETSST